MAKPNLQEIHVTLERHIAVSDERWKEAILRIKRIELFCFSDCIIINRFTCEVVNGNNYSYPHWYCSH